MTGELLAKDGSIVRKGRISPALRTAITLIVHEGLTVADAAKRTGYATESLAKALLKPHVRAFRADVKRAWLASETERAYLVAAGLVRAANSEDVQLKAARIFIDMDQDAARAMPDAARQLVQIVTQNVNLTGNLTHSQVSGVIEAEAYQIPSLPSSDSWPVGRDESDDGDDDAS
jgi:hypothetical protein